MNCPVCSKEMIKKNFGIEVDVCESGCKGIWFDQSELRMLDEKNEGLGAALEEALKYTRNNNGQRGQIKCPKCAIALQTHKYKRAKEVNVDECYNCGGFFLDSGELTETRDNYMSDAEVNSYAQEIINSVPEYGQAMKDLEAKKKRLESVQKFTGFMRVNYWRKKFQ